MHVFPVRFASEDFSFSVLMAQFTEGHSIESFLENIYNGYGSERLEASALILRPNVNDQFSTAELLEAAQGTVKEESQFLRAYGEASGSEEQAFARFDTLPIYVLHGDDLEIKVSGNINPLVTAPSEVSRALENTYALNEIREAEFRYLVNVSMALLPPLENSYYKNPSQRAARSWLRAGNIQFSRLSIDAATFWLLPHLRGCEAILVDTWSLSSIALNASRVLAQLRGQSPIPVEMLSQYQDYSEAKQAALLEILDRLCSEGMAGRGHTEDLNVTCIVSVTDTGSLVDVISNQADLSSLPLMLTFVAVFQLGRNDFLPSLCDLSGDKEFEPLDHGDSTDGSFIPIDERIYFPVTYVDIVHMAVQREADYFRPFVDMVMGRNVISVHRDQPSDGQTRHHAIHLDTKNLFELQEFKDQFRYKLGELCPPPSLIVTPPHPVAEEMGAFAADFFEDTYSFRPKLVSHTSLLLNAEGILAGINKDIRDALLAVP